MQRIADSPGLMIGVPASTPKTPTLVIVNVPPPISAGCVLPVAGRRGQLAERLRELEQRLSWSASLMFGTISPRGVAAAMPRLT